MIQEVVLVSSVLVIYGTKMIDFSRIAGFVSYMFADPERHYTAIFHDAGTPMIMRIMIQDKKQEGASLGSVP